MAATVTIRDVARHAGVGVGTVSISTVQSATDLAFPGEATTSRFISLGISSVDSAMVVLLLVGGDSLIILLWETVGIRATRHNTSQHVVFFRSWSWSLKFLILNLKAFCNSLSDEG